MIALVAAIFLASVLGSFHCAGMCGAFLAIATGADRAFGWRRAAILQAAYHVGRLVSYASLGAAVGAAGRLVNVAGALAGVRPVAAILAGAAMMTFGITALLRSKGVAIRHIPLPPRWLDLMRRGHQMVIGRPPLIRALGIGLLTTLLPCGWLYAFAVTAAGTGSPLRGTIAMIAFWAGTLPALVAMGAGVRSLLGPIGRQLPTITMIALVAAGLWTLTGRAQLDPSALSRKAQARSVLQNPASKPACCDSNDSSCH